ncbi:MAG TPA: hypothetical protein VG758_25390 [Hyphomicrobiaceae bacterium]|jgi:hypothetical protein|nr:hypothetical protein [Hyphomicrobiaceae bacterium]
MKMIQITPTDRNRLYQAMVKKESDIRRERAGAFSRVGVKTANKATWKHVRFKGRIKLNREASETVTARVSSADWQLLSAFIGWVDRHFGNQVQSVHIEYR